MVLPQGSQGDLRVMEPRKLNGETNGARGQSYPDAVSGIPGWSIRRLIELIEEAIDSAGAQLARSAGLWADSPALLDERDRPAARRQSGSLSARALLEEPDKDHGIGPS
jgi:hypothetical protein